MYNPHFKWYSLLLQTAQIPEAHTVDLTCEQRLGFSDFVVSPLPRLCIELKTFQLHPLAFCHSCISLAGLPCLHEHPGGQKRCWMLLSWDGFLRVIVLSGFSGRLPIITRIFSKAKAIYLRPRIMPSVDQDLTCCLSPCPGFMLSCWLYAGLSELPACSVTRCHVVPVPLPLFLTSDP